MPTRGRTVRATALLLLVVAVPALTGCLTSEASITVRDDRSATVDLLVLPGTTEASALGGAAGIARLAKVIDGLPGDVEAQTIERRGLPGLEVTVEVEDVATLAQPLTTPAQPGASARFFNRFDLTETEDGWLLEAEAVPLAQVVTGVPLPLSPDDSDYDLRLTLPGSITGTNAEDQEKGTGYWTVKSDPVPISMRTRTGTTINPVLVLVGVALGVILVGAVVAVWAREATVRRRLRRQAAASAAAVAAPASAWAPRTDTPVAGSGAGRSRRPRRKREPDGPAGGPAASVPGMYPEIHDGSVAVPVGGSAWGPPPPEPTPTAGPAAVPAESATPVDAAVPVAATPPSPAPAAPSPAPRPAPAATTSVEPTPTASPTATAAPAEPTPPASPPAPMVPPGWYDDPDRPGGHRYWDGTAWTEHRS